MGLEHEIDAGANDGNDPFKTAPESVDSLQELLIALRHPRNPAEHIVGHRAILWKHPFVQRRQRAMHDLVVGNRGGQLEMQLAGQPGRFQQILREPIEPTLECHGIGMADMFADDFSLLQVHLLELVGLIDRQLKTTASA